MKRSELIEIIRRVIQEKKRTDEAKVVPAGLTGVLPKVDIANIDILTEYFGEGDSGWDLYRPASETYELESYCEDEDEDDNDNRCKAIRTLLKKYPFKATFVSNDILAGALYDFPCPGAPPGSFGSCITIDPKRKEIEVEIPYIDNPDVGGRYSVGWFNSSGKYFPDTKNFDEGGNYIGDGGNVIEV